MKLKSKQVKKSCYALIKAEKEKGLEQLKDAIYDDKSRILSGDTIFNKPNPIDRKYRFAGRVVEDYRNYIDNCIESTIDPYAYRAKCLSFLFDIEEMIDKTLYPNGRGYKKIMPSVSLLKSLSHAADDEESLVLPPDKHKQNW